MADDPPAARTRPYTWDEKIRLLTFGLSLPAMVFVGVFETVLLLAAVWVLLPDETGR